MSKEQTTVTLDMDKLQEIIAATVVAAVSEMRKPDPMSDQQLANLQQQQEERKATAAGVIESKRNQRWFQEHGCTHEHSGPIGGTHCVFVHDNNVVTSPGFVYCQKCNGRFRPDEPTMRKLDPEAIFDTSMFNKLLTACVQNGAEIVG